MNQAVLLNNDLIFIQSNDCWQLTGFTNGEALTVIIETTYLPQKTNINDDILFTLESDIEAWLEKNEPDEHGRIYLK